MNRLWPVLLILLGLAVPARGTEVDSDRTAVEAYRRGDLDTARTTWTALLADGDLAPAERGRFLYNLGNVAFRKGAILEAVGWYSASLRVRPRDADAWANLEHARAEARLDPADRGDLTATLQRVLTALTLAESEWLVISAALVWLALSIGEALRGGRIWSRLAWAGVALVVLSLPPWIYQLRRQRSDPVLVVEEPKVLVHSEPRSGAAVIGEAPAGAEPERVDELPDWTKIQLAGGLEGWVKKPSVFVLRR